MLNFNAVALQIFPQGITHGRGEKNIEVNGLSAGTVPVNCEILARGQHKRTHDRREFFLVRTSEALAYLRVCTAMPNSGYAEFAVIHEIAQIGSAEAKELEEYARESIAVLCGQ